MASLLNRTPTLTDAERRAIREAADAYADNDDDPDCERIAATLRGLLDRLSPIATGDNDRPEAIDRMSKPIAWLAFATDASESSFVTLDKDEAEAAARDWGWSVVPLYAGPQNRIVCDTKMDTTPARGSVQPDRHAALERLVAMEQELELERDTPKQDTTPGEGSVQPDRIAVR